MNELDALRSDLETLASSLGGAVFGVADLEWLASRKPDLLERVPGDYTRAVVIGMRLQKAVLEDIVDRPTPLYFHNYRQTNYQLDRVAWRIAARLQDAGHSALATPASQIVRRGPMLGHVSHRLLGWAAGLGHLGRSTLLVHPRYGAQLRYVSVLTDMPLAAGSPTDEDCGDCRACIDVCPAQAIREDRDAFDLDACYAKLTEFTRLPFIGQHICGVCVKACGGKG